MRSLAMNGAGLVISFLAVLGFIGLVHALMRRGLFSAFTARKVIHIGVAHWWLLAMAMFDDPWAASIGPACSLIAAAAAPGIGPIPADPAAFRGRDRGTILYSASLLVLVNVSWRSLIPPWTAAVGVLVMGWGDGLAALAGGRSGAAVRIWGRRKTARGTAVMFAASFAAAFVLVMVFDPRACGPGCAAVIALSAAAVATVLELFTPLGMDNLTVSLGTALFCAGVFP